MYRLFIITLVYFCSKNVFANEMPDGVKEMMKSLHDTCVAETSVKEDLITAANDGNFTPDPNLKCYMKCLFTSIGIMEDDGTIDFDILIDLVPPHMEEYAKKAAANCKIAPEGNACETAYKFNVCAQKADPKGYLLF